MLCGLGVRLKVGVVVEKVVAVAVVWTVRHSVDSKVAVSTTSPASPAFQAP